MPLDGPVASWLAAILAASLAAPVAAQPVAAQPPASRGALSPGRPVAGRLAAPDADRWSVTLGAGEYAEIEVAQRGVDVVLRVLAADGAPRDEADASRDLRGAEAVRWIAPAAATWTVEVAPVGGRGAGEYEIRWAVRRAASAADRERVLADSLARAGYALSERGSNAEAMPILRRALDLRERLLGPDHLDVATSMRSLALAYDDDGKYGEAEPLYRRALAIRERVQGPDSPDVATLLNNVAILATLQGRYAESEPLHRRALAIRESALGPEHRDVGSSLNSLAALYASEGRYAEAETFYRRALAIREKVLGPSHPIVAGNLSNLALVYWEQGRFAEAEPLYRRALGIFEAVLGPDHPMVAAALSNVANLYGDQGRGAEAEALHRRALAMQEKALSPDHPELVSTLNNLAALLAEERRYAEAEPLFRQVLALRERSLGAEHREVAATMGSLGTLLGEQGRHAEAEPLFRRALAILERSVGPSHPDVGAALNSLAASLLDRGGGAAAARPLLDRAIRIFTQSPGRPDAGIHAHALRARARREQGDAAGALADLAAAIRSAESLRPRVGGGDETRAAFLGRYAADFDRMVAWQLVAGDVPRALEYAERGRARVLLDQLAAGQVDLREGVASDVRAALDARDGEARARLAEYQQRLTLLRARTELAEAERDRLGALLEDSLRAADRDFRDTYEELRNASPLWRTLVTSSGAPVPLDTVQRRLVPPRGFVLLYHVGEASSTLFLIPPAGARVTALPLRVGAADVATLGVAPGALTADALARVMRGDAGAHAGPGLAELLGTTPRGRPAGATVGMLARLAALRRVLVPEGSWRRVRAAPEVVVVPGRGLYVLPFEALVVAGGANAARARFWLDDGPAVRYAASVTALHNIERGTTDAPGGATPATVLTLSNPAFDPGEARRAAATPVVATSAPRTATTRAGFLAGGGGLPPLPATAAESEAIRRAFSSGDGATGDRVVVLQGAGATEAALRAALPGTRYVHVATHALVDAQRSSLFAALALTPPADPSPPSENDGFLQLYEVYRLRLPRLALAVLSACETNAGPAVDGEGVFALSRGFHAAGARRVVGSEWSVEDRSTAELMRAFFRDVAARERAGRAVDYAAGLRDAKRMVRVDARGRWADPYYWAPFVLTGAR